MSINRETKKTWCAHTTKYYSSIKRTESAICRDVGRPRDYCTKCSKSDREKQISYNITYTWILEKRYR